MKPPTQKTGKGARNKAPPPPPPETDEPEQQLGPDDFIEMQPVDLVENMLDLLRGGNGVISADTMKGMLFQRLDALHQLMTGTMDPGLLTPIQKLTADLKKASRTLGRAEARFLTDAYYTMQENRIRTRHQVTTLAQPKDTEKAPESVDGEAPKERVPEPYDVLEWLFTQEDALEVQIRGTLNIYSLSNRPGIWARSIKGIGPVIAAGLLAHIDIRRAPTVGHIWRFAGLDPTTVWGKGEKRPWNAALKRLCYLIGESFVKVCNRPDSLYGQLYKARKEWETERNSRQLYADQAKLALETKTYGKETDAFKWYTQGMLPPARIHARSHRRATKVFLSHLHEVMYWHEYGRLPPHPYVLDHVPGHVHSLEIPNVDMIFPELYEARQRAQRNKR